MKRRAFLKSTGGILGACSIGAPLATAAKKLDVLPKRPLGKTGEQVSIICFPGLALGREEQSVCDAALRRALDRGVNYFDVAPAYFNKVAETRMGVGLQGVDRDTYFLANKTKMRDAKGALEELERSLKLLKTDHFDLYQMHCFQKPEEVERALAPGGAMETFLKAKEQGKIRHIGFSAHTTKSALAALDGFQYDTVMFPINFVEQHTIGFGDDILKRAKERGTAVIGMKTISAGLWPKDVERTRKYWYRPFEESENIDLALRYTLDQPGVASAVPTGFLDLFEKVIDAALQYRPLTESDAAALKAMAEKHESLFESAEKSVAFLGDGGSRMCCPCMMA